MTLTAPAAHAASTLLVDDDGKGIPGDCSNPTPTFATIQGAVNAAAPGDTVQVCNGTYNESVNVAKTLTLKGNKAGVDGTTRGTSGESIVVAGNAPGFNLSANGITVDGFLVKNSLTGLTTSNANSGYIIQNNILINNTIGLYLNTVGGAATNSLVQRNKLANNDRAGSSSGNGLYSDQGLTNVEIAQNLFTNDPNAGIFIAANPGSNGIHIHDNTLRNLTNSAIVLFDNVSSVTINHNTLVNGSRNLNGGSTIFVGGASSAVDITNNTITTPNFSGIAIRGSASGITISGNVERNGGGNGIDVSSAVASATTTTFNSTRDNLGDGILYQAGTNGNQINNNFSRKNKTFDCEDANGAGTTNVWSTNDGVTESPPGIC